MNVKVICMCGTRRSDEMHENLRTFNCDSFEAVQAYLLEDNVIQK
jgi:hypothetical protein